MVDYMSEEEQSPQVVSKWKKSGEHQWTDSDVRDLVSVLRQQEECLYNTQNKDYHNSTKRSWAIERISMEIHVPVREVTETMVGDDDDDDDDELFLWYGWPRKGI